MKYFNKILAIVAMGTSLLLAANSQASLIGDAVDIKLTGSIELEDLGVLVGNGVEIAGGNGSTNFGAFLFSTESIDISASSILMNFDTSLGENAMLTFSDLDFGTGIIAVMLTSTIPPITQANVSFTATSVTLDLTDWFVSGEAGSLQLDLSKAIVNPVSAPSVVALFTLLVGGLLFTRKK